MRSKPGLYLGFIFRVPGHQDSTAIACSAADSTAAGCRSKCVVMISLSSREAQHLLRVMCIILLQGVAAIMKQGHRFSVRKHTHSFLSHAWHRCTIAANQDGNRTHLPQGEEHHYTLQGCSWYCCRVLQQTWGHDTLFQSGVAAFLLQQALSKDTCCKVYGVMTFLSSCALHCCRELQQEWSKDTFFESGGTATAM